DASVMRGPTSAMHNADAALALARRAPRVSQSAIQRLVGALQPPKGPPSAKRGGRALYHHSQSHAHRRESCTPSAFALRALTFLARVLRLAPDATPPARAAPQIGPATVRWAGAALHCAVGCAPRFRSSPAPHSAARRRRVEPVP